MRTSHGRAFSSILFFLVLVFLVPLSNSFAQQQSEGTTNAEPERAISIFTEYSGVTVRVGEQVRMDLIVANKGRSDETINVKLTKVPKGWKTSIKGGEYIVSGLYVPAGKTKNVALVLEPEKSTGPGSYAFGFEAKTADGAFSAAHSLTVAVEPRSAVGADIQVNTAYPVLRGATDAKFEFSLEVANKSEVDRIFNVFASGPKDWDFNIKPAYEEKQVSTFRIKAGQSQTVSLQVTPARDAGPGEYPVVVQVAAGESKVEVKLTVVLTGIYKLDAGTPSGLLSLEAVAGQASKFSFFVKNTGSAVNHNLSFDSFKPENWTVEFKPEKIEALQPGDMKQVEVTVKPGAQALVGDYSVGVSITGEKADKTLEMRVTVKSSAAWGWISIVIILVVIAGLCALFIVLGRR
ncbi:MAG: NEW3 domain-containing protein [Syntrophorhabdales bacterium]|jgi:uncharacterized membrane protein